MTSQNDSTTRGSRVPLPVIAVAGQPGAGKTTLAHRLARELGGAMLSMDDYQSMTAMPIPELIRWADQGADYDRLPVPRLALHLAQLREGRPIRVPSTGAVVEPGRCIVLETHFGRAHRQTAALIDLLIWLDTPPDVALARNLRNALAPAPRAGVPDDPEARLRWAAGYLDAYLAIVARLVHLQVERIRPTADLRIAADMPSDTVVGLVRTRLAALTRVEGNGGETGSVG
ncbi:MAG: hypothetical protein RIS35_2786 [Pseudomonadota bacterium]|jgi:uridine kinase